MNTKCILIFAILAAMTFAQGGQGPNFDKVLATLTDEQKVLFKAELDLLKSQNLSPEDFKTQLDAWAAANGIDLSALKPPGDALTDAQKALLDAKIAELKALGLTEEEFRTQLAAWATENGIPLPPAKPSKGDNKNSGKLRGGKTQN